MDRLRDDLWIRWRRQMDRSSPDPEPAAGGRRRLYGRGPLFDLKNYTPHEFKPGGRTSSQPFAGVDNWIYRLDSAGRPVAMETRHSHNGIDWRGVYQYMPEGAEYAEWCLQTGVCSQHDRVTIRDGQTVAFQRLSINARGSFPVWRGVSQAKLMERIASDPKNYRIVIERYDVRDGRADGGEAYTEGLGVPPMHSTLKYVYLDGTLDRVVERSPSGDERTVFAAERPVSLQQLSDDLSRRIGELTVDLAGGRASESPLTALELSYRSLESYVPLIIPSTEHDDRPSLCLAVAIDPRRWIELPEESLAPAITDFHERLRTTEQYDVGTQMLRNAARHVNALAPTRLRTSAFFVAYAIDWEAEGDQLDTILQECGATAESLDLFRSRDWI
jgi:hypothetical protein